MGTNLYIINPKGNGGAGVKAWGKFRKLSNEKIDDKDVIYTERPSHATEIAAAAEGYETIVSVGGDGTVNEVLQGVMRNESRPALALIPAGTGNDVGRNVGINSVNDAFKALNEHHTEKYDLLEAEYGEERRYSFLYTTFGFSGSHRVKPWMKRLLGPKIAYYLATFLEIILYHPLDMIIKWDEGQFNGKAVIVIVANVERSGGGSMVIGPGATPIDGKMTVTIVPFKSKFDMLFRKFPKTPTGEIIHEPEVLFFQANAISVSSSPPADMDMDGEIHGITPAVVRILPRAVEVVSLQNKLSSRSNESHLLEAY